MVRRRARTSERAAHDGAGRGERGRSERGLRRRGRGRLGTWRRAADRASEIVRGVPGALVPALRPAVVPIPVRTTRQARRAT